MLLLPALGGGHLAARADLGSDPTPQNSLIDAIAKSPTYAADHTVFAAGQQLIGCTTVATCPETLFRSQDGGVTWQSLYQYNAEVFGAVTRILISPHFDSDHTVFIGNHLGLNESTDGGRTFRVVVEGAGSSGWGIAIAPAPTGSDARVAMVNLLPGGEAYLVLYYDVQSETVTPGPIVSPQVEVWDAEFAEDWDHLLISGATPPYTTSYSPLGQHGVVLHCDLTACTTTTFPQNTVAAEYIANRTGGRTVFAYSQGAGYTSDVYVSRDFGVTFTADDPPVTDELQEAPYGIQLASDFASSGSMFLFTRSFTTGVDTFTLATDTGTTGYTSVTSTSWPLASPPFSSWINVAVRLDDGNLIGGIDSAPQTNIGLRCSRDGGASWQLSC